MIIENVTQTEGMLTYNFFYESLIASMQNLLHVLEHTKDEPPEKLGQLPDMLTTIGTDMMNDYAQKKLDMDRIKKQLVEFYTTAFKISEEMIPIISRNSDEMRYYYFVFEQGVKLMFACLMENILADMPAVVDTNAIMKDFMQTFAEEEGRQ